MHYRDVLRLDGLVFLKLSRGSFAEEKWNTFLSIFLFMVMSIYVVSLGANTLSIGSPSDWNSPVA